MCTFLQCISDRLAGYIISVFVALVTQDFTKRERFGVLFSKLQKCMVDFLYILVIFSKFEKSIVF